MTRIRFMVCLSFLLVTLSSTRIASAAELELVGTSKCTEFQNGPCDGTDAIVFVHGIYGDKDTFVNNATHFDWPKEFPRTIADREIDVYRLMYPTELAGWANGSNPLFDQLAESVLNALKPLRIKRYRTIGFIAHSLGGNIISTYIHSLKTKIGHPQRSQNAFIITLATPVLGSQWADRADYLKSALGMNDDLLRSLKEGNLYLRMLNEFRLEEVEKERRYICRPVNLHAAYEQEYLGPILVVSQDSAALPISNLVASPIIGFPVSHLEIAKPKDANDSIYRWVMDRVDREYILVRTWEVAHANAPASRRLCELMDFLPEKP